MATPSTYLNLNAAAKHSGWNKSTLSKAIKSGRLPVKERKGNQYFIDPIDLEREFPQKAKIVESTNNNQQNKQLETEATNQKIKELELKLEHANERLKEQSDILQRERESHAETKAEKLKLIDTLQSQTLLLSDMRDKATEKPVEQQVGFWGRLLGK